ncbi:MAG TPA: ankyrin repeat domain-containing protein, partial [Vineibacter sp.]|nr:ankyrin repeat domain-containing protein [Vineibacter sp.]
GDPSAAARILARSPDIATDSLYAAVAAGNLDECRRRLAADPAAATRRGGPLDWEPLLYLAYARLPGGAVQALDVARLLLDCGADPNASFNDGWDNPFTVLTGVIGEGEGGQPPHPHAVALVTLLVERGANPFDTQALYNTSLQHDDTTWLDVLWALSEQRGAVAPWRAVSDKIGGRVPLAVLDYLLGNAVANNHLQRAQWLLTHGADAGGVHAYSTRPLREQALVVGNVAMADLLERHGAPVVPLQGLAAFQAACMRLDRDEARALVARDPSYLHHASLMLRAAEQGRADVVALLLELGMDVDIADDTQQRGLHNAAGNGAIEVARLLIAHGADVDRPTTRYGGALGFAGHFGYRDMAAFLAPLSRDVPALVYLGMEDRLRALFAAEPALVNAVHPKSGETPLFALPDDEDQAVRMTEFLMAQGADPTIRNSAGLTAEKVARKRGLTDAADLMTGNED